MVIDARLLLLGQNQFLQFFAIFAREQLLKVFRFIMGGFVSGRRK
jgi:hypothetical protein